MLSTIKEQTNGRLGWISYLHHLDDEKLKYSTTAPPCTIITSVYDIQFEEWENEKDHYGNIKYITCMYFSTSEAEQLCISSAACLRKSVTEYCGHCHHDDRDDDDHHHCLA